MNCEGFMMKSDADVKVTVLCVSLRLSAPCCVRYLLSHAVCSVLVGVVQVREGGVSKQSTSKTMEE